MKLLIFLIPLFFFFVSMDGAAEAVNDTTNQTYTINETYITNETWVNEITVTEKGLSWEYTETFTGTNSVSFRSMIDKEKGDDDGFVSAWEILEYEKKLRGGFSDVIRRDPDVRIDDSFEYATLKDIDIDIPDDALGNINRDNTIVNKYKISYTFNDSLYNHNSLWLMGRPDSPVTIHLTLPYISVRNVGGIMALMRNDTGGQVTLRGTFGDMNGRGEITLNFSRIKNITSIPESTLQNPHANGSIAPLQEKKTSGVLKWVVIAVLLSMIVLIYAFGIRKKPTSVHSGPPGQD